MRNGITCIEANTYCNEALVAPYEITGRNVYDVRIFGNYGNIMDRVTDFGNRDEIRAAFSVAEGVEFAACSQDV